jgi:hypothetical protein
MDLGIDIPPKAALPLFSRLPKACAFNPFSLSPQPYP